MEWLLPFAVFAGFMVILAVRARLGSAEERGLRLRGPRERETRPRGPVAAFVAAGVALAAAAAVGIAGGAEAAAYTLFAIGAAALTAVGAAVLSNWRGAADEWVRRFNDDTGISIRGAHGSARVTGAALILVGGFTTVASIVGAIQA